VEQAGDATFQGESHHLLAITHAAQGNFHAATEHIESGLRMARLSRDVEREGRLYVELARISAARGDQGAAAEQLNTGLTVLTNASAVYSAQARELLEKLNRGELETYEVVAFAI